MKIKKASSWMVLHTVLGTPRDSLRVGWCCCDPTGLTSNGFLRQVTITHFQAHLHTTHIIFCSSKTNCYSSIYSNTGTYYVSGTVLGARGLSVGPHP